MCTLAAYDVGLVGRDGRLAAVAAYPTYEARCHLVALAVVATKHPDVAGAVRARWVREVAVRLLWRRTTQTTPESHDR